MVDVLSLAIESAPSSDYRAGWVALAVVAAMVVVACWRYVLYLLVVALVALSCLGLLTLFSEPPAAAGPDVPPPASKAEIAPCR